MSSIEKKEIIQNGVFGTVAGLVMGGPIGAISVALTAAGLSHLQEINDQKKRDVYQRDSITSAQREAIREEVALKYKIEKENTKDLKDLMIMERPQKLDYKIFSNKLFDHYTAEEKLDYIQTYNKIIDDVYMEYDKCYVEIDFDLLRNQQVVGRKNRLDPDKRPYVIIKRYSNKNDLQNGENPISIGKGKILKREIFREELLKDLHNPEIEKYQIFQEKVVGCINSGVFRYMYTIDNGENYSVCW